MKFCDTHWTRLEAELADRVVTREIADVIVTTSMGFDRADEDACAVRAAVQKVAADVNERWVANCVLAIVCRTDRRET